MIRQIIRLVQPGVFLPRFTRSNWPDDDQVLVRPTYLSICAADQRYFTGDRPERVLRNKLPMALLHEAVGEVLYDPEGRFSLADKVVLVPCAAERSDEGILPNYIEKSSFYSSTCDGFAQEYLPLPRAQLLKVPGDEEKIYVFGEMTSVCIHAITRWRALRGASHRRARIGIWGDGALGYILALALKTLEPKCNVIIFGKHDEKLAFFSFADDVFNVASRQRCRVDHAFECVGGDGAALAINDIIACAMPQGFIFLLGVSERHPTVQTRMILEKGLVLVGCSRSAFSDFQQAVSILQSEAVQVNLQKIISDEVVIRNARDLELAFKMDKSTAFKTLLRWTI